jgi:hypothetical protein
MKKNILFPFALLLSLFVRAQQFNPSYIEIIKSFCSQYEPSEEYENYTTFSKKREGWYVLQVNKIKSDSILNETLFYSFSEKKFYDLSTYYNKAESPDVEKLLGRYLNYGGSIFDWYAFERIPYYGYNGWNLDVIKDFTGKHNLQDTFYDGLGRAYDNLAQSYTWFIQGGAYPYKDTLHTKLQRLQYPSKQRVLEMKVALDSAIAKVELLCKLNPDYVTIIGNARLKVFNEYMHGYMQMNMSRQPELANEFVTRAILPEAYEIQAKNYLNSCERNAVLFTYGDNDTYQLWYVQEKYSYRKDVTVINNSLLGVAAYIDMLKRSNAVKISMPDNFLSDPGCDVSYYREEKNKSGSSIQPLALPQLLQQIYKKKNKVELSDNLSAPSYAYKFAYTEKTILGNKKRIMLKLNDYHFLNDVGVLDILLNNFNSRPIYFSSNDVSYLSDYLQQTGIIYKLITEKAAAPAQQLLEINGLQKFIAEKYQPVLSNKNNILSFDGDNIFFGMYYRLFNYYLEKKDTASCKRWLQKMELVCPEIKLPQLKGAKNLIYIYTVVCNEKKAIVLAEQYAVWLHEAYLKPTSLNGYYSKEAFTNELKLIQSMLSANNYKSNFTESLISNLD